MSGGSALGSEQYVVLGIKRGEITSDIAIRYNIIDMLVEVWLEGERERFTSILSLDIP